MTFIIVVAVLDTSNWYDHIRNLTLQFVPLISWYASNIWCVSTEFVHIIPRPPYLHELRINYLPVLCNLWIRSASSRTMTFADFCSDDMKKAQIAVQQCDIVSESALKRACVARLEVAQQIINRVGCCTRFSRALCCCCAGKQDDGDSSSAIPLVDFGTLFAKCAPTDDGSSDSSKEDPQAASCSQSCSRSYFSAYYAQTFLCFPGMRFDERDSSFICVIRIMSVLGSQSFFLAAFGIYQTITRK
jgi:hypothetical protein